MSGVFNPAGSGAASTALVTWVLIGLGGTVYVLVVLVMVGALRRRRLGPHSNPGSNQDRGAERLFILGGGIALPAVVLLAVAVVNVWGMVVQPQGGEFDIEVIGHQYWWEIRYPDHGVVTANEFHIPVGRRVRLLLRSEDVIHSFWVPELAGKRDLVPGRVNTLTIEAQEPGTYRGQCAEFCGIQHANMALLVTAESPESFAAWVEDQAAPAAPPTTASEMAGSATFETVGCGACHTIRGTGADGEAGPDLTHFAQRRTIGAGAAPNDRGHLGGWVVDAQSLKPGNLMPPVPVPAEELTDLLDYLESLE